VNQILLTLTFVLGVLLGGAIADGGVGDFLAIAGGCVGLGAGVGAAAIWILERDPRWDRGVGYGSLLGLLVGLALAIVDAAAGG
jgi:hypothetical protein